MHSFERLIREHTAISARARSLIDAIDGGASPLALHAALSALEGELGAHLAHEDAAIYPKLMVSADESAAAAREAVRRFETLAADWTDHARKWTTTAIARSPRRFGEATRAILGRLGERIKLENELLYPMALGASHIRLRDSEEVVA